VAYVGDSGQASLGMVMLHVVREVRAMHAEKLRFCDLHFFDSVYDALYSIAWYSRASQEQDEDPQTETQLQKKASSIYLPGLYFLMPLFVQPRPYLLDEN
jgi:hypothetical protein